MPVSEEGLKGGDIGADMCLPGENAGGRRMGQESVGG